MLEGVVGRQERDEGDITAYRPQQVAFVLAKRVLDTPFNTSGEKRPWLFPRLVELSRWWVDNKAEAAEGYSLRALDDHHESQVLAAERISDAIVKQAGNRRERLRPMIDRFRPVSSTG